MSRLPLLLSVPHAGLEVPPALVPYCRLTPDEIAADGDVGARAIYDLQDMVQAYVTTPVARAILDMNRARDDRRKDGIVKTHTCWDVPVYEPTPPEEVFSQLIAEHHQPYHARLSKLGPTVRAAFDCHTMAAFGPPVGPDHGVERPAACLGDGGGTTCPPQWIEAAARHFAAALGRPVTINQPFAGGYIVRRHKDEIPWIQIELSRAPYLSDTDKRAAVLAALTAWCQEMLPEVAS